MTRAELRRMLLARVALAMLVILGGALCLFGFSVILEQETDLPWHLWTIIAIGIATGLAFIALGVLSTIVVARRWREAFLRQEMAERLGEPRMLSEWLPGALLFKNLFRSFSRTTPS